MNETQSWCGIQGAGAFVEVKGDKTLADLVTQFGVHPIQISEWNPHVLARAVDVFGSGQSTSDAPDLTVLHAKIWQLALQYHY